MTVRVSRTREGGTLGEEALLKCPTCPRRYHQECVGVSTCKGWRCLHCAAGDKDTRGKPLKSRIAAVRAAHRRLKSSTRVFLEREEARIAPVVPKGHVRALLAKSGKAKKEQPACVDQIDGGSPAWLTNASLREYQVDGVNWLLGQYNVGMGGILGDEMGRD